jgi:hypothetical protein
MNKYNFSINVGNIKPQSAVFEEIKGQMKDQFWKSRPDVLYYGASEGMNYFIKNSGMSYQLSRVESWKDEEDLTHSLKEANDAELAEVKQMQLNQLKTEIEPNQLLVKIDKTYQSDVQKTAPNQVDALIQREQALQTKLSAKISSNEKITAKSDKPELQAESEVLAELLEASKEREAQIQQQKQ